MNETEDLSTRVGKLRGEASRYRERYGDLDELRPLERLDNAIAARRSRLKHLREIGAEIAAEITAVEVEVAGIERGIEALLGDVLPRVARQFDEAWSPSPVLGYRLWAVGNNEYHGVRTHWAAPELTATCDSSRLPTEIPHSDGRCGRLGCGIYAAKDVGRLLSEFAPALRSNFAVGLIAMTGKVVEHQYGYRGATASVVALVTVDSLQAEFTSESDQLEDLFGGDGIHPTSKKLADRSLLFDAIVEYLTEHERALDPWT